MEKIVRRQTKETKKFEAQQRKSLRAAAKSGTFKQVRHSTNNQLSMMKKRHDHEVQ